MGGTPVRTKGPIVEEDVIENEELEALIKVFKSKRLRRGETTLEYERKIADWFGGQACYRCNQRHHHPAYRHGGDGHRTWRRSHRVPLYLYLIRYLCA